MIMDIDVVGQMLEDKGLSHSEIDEWFEHAGIKGMKWGVHRERRLASTVRVAEGKGSALDKARQLAKTSPLVLLANKGSLKKVAQKRGKRITGRKERILKGEAKVTDLLAMMGTVRIQDVFDRDIRSPKAKV